VNKVLAEIIRRAEAWPKSAQEEFAELAREIDAELTAGSYRATH
jgi:hypothetical protein